MTDKPDSASRYAATAPPKPDPTTTASPRSGAGLRSPGPVAISGRLPLEELADPREDVGVGALAHDRVDVTVAGEDLELGHARRDLAEQLVAGDVGVGEDPVVVPGQQQHRRGQLRGVRQVVLGEVAGPGGAGG